MLPYTETVPSRRAWLILLAVCAVAWGGLMLMDRDAIATATAIVLMLGGIAAITMWSQGRYGNIRLTDTEIKVGRETIPLTEINPFSVSGPGQPVEGRLVGGAYAPTLGSGAVGAVRRDGRQVIITTQDPEALRSALEEALAPMRGQAAP